MANIKIKTKGMHCTSCETLVKDALEELKGVNKAEASFKSGIIAVDFDDKKTTKDEIMAVIKLEGYKIK